MRDCTRVLLLCGLLLVSGVSPALGFFGSGAMPDNNLFAAKPGYQKTAQDYLDEGNYWKEQCEAVTAGMAEDREVCNSLDDGVSRADCHAEVSSKYNRSWDLSRLFLGTDKTGYGTATSSRGKVVMDAAPVTPDACGNAKRAYSKAFQLTRDEDYDMKAEILSEGAGIYHILGMTDEARQVGEAAEAARDRKAASGLFSALLPLSAWVALLGVIGGVLVLKRRR
ncbi:MAG TPA: hypothetical protein HA272_08950 [Methanoregula sp.]|nr:hypothetical protein [Methanoregula sp.]